MKVRRLLEYVKWIEGVRFPLLAGLVYRLTTRLDNFLIKREKIPANPLNTEIRDKKIIVSLTSFPARIEYVHLAIKSLILQTYKPDRIILWLAESQFPDKQLPQQLTDLQQFGLEIKWCEDMKSHKKYVEPIKQQKNDELVITYDDDIIYSPLSIERLIKTHITHPNCIICERAQSIQYSDRGVINPHKWTPLSDVGVHSPSFSLNPSLGGGCLFPYNALNEEATDWNFIKTFALYDDDVWIMFMAALNATPQIKTRKYHRIFSTVTNSQEKQLAHINIHSNLADETFFKLSSTYTIAYQRITGKAK